MQTKHFRLIPLLAAGLLSCQDQASNTTAPTEPGSVALTARLTTATGDSIPAVDSIRFKVKVGQKDTDLVVPWTAHKLDLGTAKLGDSIHWQATGWKWNEAKTQRSIVWATLAHDTLVGVGGTKTTFTLATPISGQSYALPALTTTAFTVGTLDTVAVPSGTGSFPFAFTVPVTDSVWINDTLQVGTAGSFSKNVTIAAGTSVPVKVVLKDALGAITIRTFTLKRPAATTTTTVDSGSVVAFSNPGATEWSLPNGTSTLNVVLQATPKNVSLKVDTVLLNGKPMTWNAENSNWTLMVTGIAVGTDTILTATPYVGGVKGTSSSVTVRQLAPGAIDSGSTVTFINPSETVSSLPYGSSVLNVKIQAAANMPSLHVDSVKLNGIKILDSNGYWIHLVAGIREGVDTVLVATPYVLGKAGTSATVTLKQMVATVKDSGSTATFVAPAEPRYLIANEITFKALQVKVDLNDLTLKVDSVLLNGKSMITADKVLWNYTVYDLPVAKDSILVVTPYVGGVMGNSDTVTLRRLGKLAAAPEFDVEPGTYDTFLSVKMTTASDGASIECSLDSITWDACASGSVISIKVSDTLYARSVGSGYESSAVKTAAYLLKAKTPKLFVFPGSGLVDTIELSVDGDLGFMLQYLTKDGWVNSGGFYDVIRAGDSVYARSVKDGWIPSDVVARKSNLKSSGYLTDSRDGLVYSWTRIGAQVWMGRNLNYSGGGVGSCYGDTASYCVTYGRLYTWGEAVGNGSGSSSSPSGVRGICPYGWHLPSDAEWSKLTDTTLDIYTAGIVLRSRNLWPTNVGDVAGTDDKGFAALPAGSRNNTSGYSGLLSSASFWTATKDIYLGYSWSRMMGRMSGNVLRSSENQLYSLSVRCLLD